MTSPYEIWPSLFREQIDRLNWDKKSNLAAEIKRKIQLIEQKFEIVLYKMRNGRRTSIPRYFLKGGVYTGHDSNVNSLTNSAIESLDGSEDISSFYGGTTFFGRYSFYPNSKISFSPEMNFLMLF